MKIITNLLKVKSIVTFGFLALTITAVMLEINLPEWLIPMVTLCFKELFDKDKVNIKKDEEV